ncbi:MAG: ferritin-like domain-containing protein [Myxococcota bacterium]
MTKFETLLASHLLAMSIGCVGTKGTPPSTDSATLTSTPTACDAATSAGTGYTGTVVLSVGYVAVAPGEPCPPVEDVTSLGHETCCPEHVFAGTVCASVGREDHQIASTGYGYYGTATDTAVAGVVDLCLYEGTFEVTGACCGRPLLQDGRPVVSGLTRTDRWAHPDAPDVRGMTAEQRQEHGEHWLRAALLEHASVASFARFTLDLLRYGAPPELVARAQRAALEEVDHARRCFALAGAYLGQPLGPGEMALGEAVALSASFAAFAEAVVREGCVGETLSVFDAAHRLQQAHDPALRTTLQTLRDDESAHASLAWDTLRWALERDPSLAAHLHEVFADEERRAAPALREGWARVIGPSWAALAS